MAFPGLLETSKMEIFASIVHHLCTNNVYVSKIYPSGLIFGGHIYEGLIFGMLTGLHIWRGCILKGSLYMGSILTGFYGIYKKTRVLRYILEVHQLSLPPSLGADVLITPWKMFFRKLSKTFNAWPLKL